jgi:phage/plasmid-like protein (TIGR03299 family)
MSNISNINMQDCHKLDMTTGKASMFSSRGMVPWHGLGTVISEDAATSADAIKYAGLDYSLFKTPLWTVDGDGNKVDVPENFAVVRGDTSGVLGVVGKNYKIFQNSEAFEFFDSVVGDKLAIYETAGALHDGRIVWVLAKLPSELRVGKTEDVTNAYIMLATSHDGSMSVTMTPTLVRVVCNNTFTLAIRGFSIQTGIKMRHTKNMSTKIDIARERLGIVNKQVTDYSEQMNALANRKINKTELKSYIESLFPDNDTAKNNTRTENMRDQIYENWAETEFAQIEGTAWAAFNAVTKFVDHQRSTKGSDDSDRASNRMYSVLMSSGAVLKREAFQAALALV